MASVSTSSPSVDDIRRSMAQIRQKLHQDMQGVVAGAEAASDWKHYVKMYPIVALVFACGAGYLIVPRKRRSVTQTAQKAAEAVVAKLSDMPTQTVVMATPPQPVVAAPAPVTATPPSPKSSLFGSLFGMVTPILMKAAQNYALNYIGTLMEQMEQATGPQPEPGPAPTQGTRPSQPQSPFAR